jgi:hypothetical protein
VAFSQWKNLRPTFVAGSGKSVLWYAVPTCFVHSRFISFISSAIIEDIRRMQWTTSALIACHYFDFKDSAKRDLRGLLSSILMQFGADSDKSLRVLSQLHTTITHRDGSEQPSEESLVQVLKIMLKESVQLPVYVIVDALDECPNNNATPSARKKVLDFMTDLIKSEYPNLHLCITSRPEQDIQTALDPLTSTSPRVSLHEECGQREDIKNYIRYFVQTNDTMLRKWRTGTRRW